MVEELETEVAPIRAQDKACLLMCFDKKPTCGLNAVSAIRISRHAGSCLLFFMQRASTDTDPRNLKNLEYITLLCHT